MAKKVDQVLILILFYAGWFGAVFLARTEFALGSLVFPAALFIYLKLKGGLTGKESFAALGIAAFGGLFDFFMIQVSFIDVVGANPFMLPVWLLSIWLLFAFSILKLGPTLNMPLWIAVILGCVMGPLSYKSGELFQVLSFTSSFTFFAYAVFWSALFPMVLFLAKRLA